MKKHLALVLALVMVLTSFSFVSAAPDFSDMEGHANAEAVARLELLNVLKGYPDGSFKPDNTITRAEFAAVAVRVSGLENVAVAAQGLPTGFTDVPAWHWASGYVGTAAKMGIVNGIGNGLFAPETPVKYEEAITMIVRALGYEPMAQARGGYPFGYLIVANEIDLLDGAMGTQGTWATRGFVAQITDNALEIPMMIQVGFGSDTKWVVSGKEDTDEVYLLDRMGFDTVEGRVTEVDVDDMEIYINAEVLADRGWYDVAEGFDFYAMEGVEVKAWLDGDMVILAAAQEDVSFDAVEIDGDEITLVDADRDYDLADDVTLFVDGSKVRNIPASAEYEYAKVVFDDEGDVIWVDAITTLDFIVVEEIDDEMILDLDEEEVVVEDYLIVMDGKTISVDDLETGDVVFYFEADYKDYDGFAVVYNSSIVGEITRVYTDSFRMNGSNYEWLVGESIYIDGNTLDTLTADILDKMMDEGNDVEAFFNFKGEVVLVVGETGEGDTSTFYAVLIDDAVAYNGRRGEMLALDMLNEFGEEVSFDITLKFIDEDFDFSVLELEEADNYDLAGALVIFDAEAEENVPFLFEVEVDEDGSLEALTLLEVEALTHEDGFEIDDTYAEVNNRNYRLMSTTVVFYDYDDGEFGEVLALGEIDDEFAVVEAGYALADEGRVKVVLATSTDADSDDTDYTGLVTKTRQLRTGELEVTILVEGKEHIFTTADDWDIEEVTVYEIYTLVVGDTSGEITDIIGDLGDDYVVDSVDASARKLTLEEYGQVELASNAYIYEAGTKDTMRLRDVAEGSNVYVVFEEDTDYWVIYMLVDVEPAPGGDDVVEGEITYINSTYTRIVVDGTTTYVIDSNTEIWEDGAIVAVGFEDIAELDALVVGDIVEDIVVEDGVVVSLVKVVEAE
ncbi:S-layer homology domain-containing protein [Gudongella sp. SC589]|uniref:S-layer homology domain-containing protein n=1 Tax=Gudongella sp. SC589 TaxID=3385990 RepID=UPI0039049B37